MSRPAQLRNYQLELAGFRQRVVIAAGFVVVLFLLLLARFFYVQVLEYQRYHTLAENNRITVVPTPPNRGLILDRHGVVMAHNYSAYTLEITPSKTGDLDATINGLAQLVEITPAQRKRFAKLMAESRNFEALPLRTRLTDEEVAKLAANRYRFPGVEVKARLFRQYPLGASASHLLGYIGRINDADLKRLDEEGVMANYRGSDHIGKVGIEQSYETELHGITGAEQVETDAGGHAVRTLSRINPVSGNSLVLYLDSKLQAVAEKAFGSYRGALVAIDPKTGGVLAFVSTPGFDPNLFVDGIDTASWNALNDSPDKPLLNRALRSAYPEGSTIKPFMALAGLSYGVRKPSDTIFDPGYFSLPNSSHRYRDWKAGGHGMVDMHKSIVQSCDTYYYRLANDLGIDRMHAFLSQFGFGRKTGIDMEGEVAGVLPSREWKAKRSRQPWYPGETVIAGIGQGYNLVTPLQLAVATAALANGGIAFRPQLVQAIIDSRTGQRRAVLPQVLNRIKLNPADLQVVVAAMEDVTRPGGTAAAANAGAPYLIAAKTGTAQVVGIKQGEKYDARRVLARHRDHAVYIAFAPADAPRIALAVLVENGMHGGTTAAPIARAVMDYYLLGKLPKSEVLKAPAGATGEVHAD
ncbi:penicillin-binding protein 2 [Sulfuriferula plumbiphila]|uniref:Peptidoglycan D,D-transpeptidase MrdA n=1 Tax=Sulfuriferula plumbiphila TaxID=171865 RepID=A0A512L462_9PROT|nr:penicillin-binding protein 2 [Sulfuriferula plumbiphila]BBP02697.1 penicillin-binding protein 2 [Sulfuriferula plumbiphila]GEP28991.1 penicillin-binding protein 2 [Sulfuriferula plumbiphila]